MGRTIQDTYYETTIAGATVGASPAVVFADQIQTWLGQFQSNGVVAWDEKENSLNGVALSNQGGGGLWTLNDGRIYRTRGDRNLASGAGDASGVIVVDPFTATQIRFASGHDYGTVNVGADRRLATPQAGILLLTMTASTDLFIAATINEYGVMIVTNQGGTWALWTFEVPVRSHIPDEHIGIAKTTAIVTGTGSNQVIPLDRDISGSIVVGQDVWMVPQTADGAAFETPSVEVESVVAVTASSITLAPTNNYAAGALIGLDPSVMLQSANTAGNTSFCSIDEEGDVSQAVNVTWSLMTTLNESANDPGGFGFHKGWRMEYGGADPVPPGVTTHRGQSALLSGWTTEGQSRILGDDNRDNLDDTRLFAPFPDFTGFTGGFEFNFGPYETAKT